MTTYSLTILLISILFCTVSTVLMIMLKRSNTNQAKLLSQMQASLETRPKNGDDQEDHQRTAALFDDNLRAAELTTRLQQPRLTLQQCGYSPATPERYQYIRSMVDQGMSAADIAAMLSKSLHETSQLIALIRVTRQHSASDTFLPSEDVATTREMSVERPGQQCEPRLQQQGVPAGTTGVVKKSFKFARWLKGRTTTPYIRKQRGREPPPQPLPLLEQGVCNPLSGYT